MKDHLAAAKASVEKAEDEGVLDRLHECCMNDGDGGTHPTNYSHFKVVGNIFQVFPGSGYKVFCNWRATKYPTKLG